MSDPKDLIDTVDFATLPEAKLLADSRSQLAKQSCSNLLGFSDAWLWHDCVEGRN
jgi:hypothetical protein